MSGPAYFPSALDAVIVSVWGGPGGRVYDADSRSALVVAAADSAAREEISIWLRYGNWDERDYGGRPDGAVLWRWDAESEYWTGPEGECASIRESEYCFYVPVDTPEKLDVGELICNGTEYVASADPRDAASLRLLVLRLIAELNLRTTRETTQR